MNNSFCYNVIQLLWQENVSTAAATQSEHFGPIVAKKTLKNAAAAAPCERTLPPTAPHFDWLRIPITANQKWWITEFASKYI